MASNAILGTIAGAAGTMALDVTTYGDMLLRGRSASGVPAQAAGILADKAGINLAAGGASPEQAESRRSAIGALLGYLTGAGIGTVYGLVRPRLGTLPTPLAGAAVGLAAMAASDVPIARLGVSNPAEWAPEDWAADLLPHLAYGIVTVAAYEVLRGW